MSISNTLHCIRYSSDKILKVGVFTASSNVKSRSHHDVAHLHPLTNIPTKYQLPIVSEIYPLQDFKGQGQYSKVKGQTKLMPFHTQVSTSYTLGLWFPRYSSDKILKVKVTAARSKVKSRSHHDNAHIHPLTNVPTKFQLSIPYGFRDIAQTRF